MRRASSRRLPRLPLRGVMAVPMMLVAVDAGHGAGGVRMAEAVVAAEAGARTRNSRICRSSASC